VHPFLVLGTAIGAFVATVLGGLLTLRYRDKLHLMLGFSAGAVIAVAFFDLLPEALTLGGHGFNAFTILSVTAIGFFFYVTLDRLIVLHTRGGGGLQDRHSPRGWIGATSLSAHSLMDGFAIGIAFQASTSAGAIVAAAVLTHDCSDGMNTANLVLKNGGSQREALIWLIMDAAAPILGASGSLFLRPSENLTSLLLALFAGFFLYIGASDLLPESHHAHPKFLTTVMTLLGAGALYLAIRLAG
jgi:zinc transporter ZupT